MKHTVKHYERTGAERQKVGQEQTQNGHGDRLGGLRVSPRDVLGLFWWTVDGVFYVNYATRLVPQISAKQKKGSLKIPPKIKRALSVTCITTN